MLARVVERVLVVADDLAGVDPRPHRRVGFGVPDLAEIGAGPALLGDHRDEALAVGVVIARGASVDPDALTAVRIADVAVEALLLAEARRLERLGRDLARRALPGVDQVAALLLEVGAALAMGGERLVAGGIEQRLGLGRNAERGLIVDVLASGSAEAQRMAARLKGVDLGQLQRLDEQRPVVIEADDADLAQVVERLEQRVAREQSLAPGRVRQRDQAPEPGEATVSGNGLCRRHRAREALIVHEVAQIDAVLGRQPRGEARARSGRAEVAERIARAIGVAPKPESAPS